MLKVKVNFKLGRRLVHALSTTMASYKGLCSYCTRTGEYRVGRTRDGHTTCWFYRALLQLNETMTVSIWRTAD